MRDRGRDDHVQRGVCAGGDPAVLGPTLHVHGVALLVAGVMPAGFDGVSGRAALWLPTGMASA